MNDPMLYAIRLAEKKRKSNDVPIACVIADNYGKIVSSATNSVIKNCDPTAHAEIIAIRKACQKLKTKNLSNFTMFVTLEPCLMCEYAIYNADIRKIYFGAYKKSLEIKKKKINYFNEKKNHSFYGGIEEVKCSGILKRFFKKLR